MSVGRSSAEIPASAKAIKKLLLLIFHELCNFEVLSLHDQILVTALKFCIVYDCAKIGQCQAVAMG